jgi:cytochrome c-type biogenesis protein CcmE
MVVRTRNHDAVVWTFCRHYIGPVMRARTKRLYAVAGASLLVLSSLALAFIALGQRADLFYTPQMLVERGQPEAGRRIRLGGFVQAGSVDYGAGAEMFFTVEDGSEATVRVTYTGITPDLFREGQGVVATGRFEAGADLFKAEQILAKHDENYQPRELRDLSAAPAS